MNGTILGNSKLFKDLPVGCQLKILSVIDLSQLLASNIVGALDPQSRT